MRRAAGREGLGTREVERRTFNIERPTSNEMPYNSGLCLQGLWNNLCRLRMWWMGRGLSG